MFWVLVTVFILVITLVVNYFKNIYVFNKKLEKLPSPPGNFLLGHSWYFLNSQNGMMYTIFELMRQYGNTLTLRIGPDKAIVCTSDYKFVEFFLSHTQILKKAPDYDYLHRWLGTGLLVNSGGPKWKKHRKILTPAFHFKILEQYVNVFHSVGEILINKLEKQVDKERVNIVPYLTLYSLDVICETAMGTSSVNAQKDMDSEYVRSVKNMCRIIIDRSFSLWKCHDFLYLFSKDYRKELKSLKILHSYSDNVINTKLSQRQEIASKDKMDDEGTKEKKSFLDLLLSEMEPKSLSLKDIKEEVATFMFAGHDTTASALSFLIYNLATYPDIQERVYQEQKEIFRDDFNRTLNIQDLRGMKYLELVIKETLRLYPSVPFYGREVEEDVLYDGYILPKGLTCMMFPFALHRNPEYFPDPEKFDPSRFEQMQGQYPYAYVPFSSGPRNCIGQKFAMASIKSIASELVRTFEFLSTDPPHQPQLMAETVLISENGINVRIKKRPS